MKFTVAIIGPDGAGKTTIAHKLIAALPMRATYLYMGVNFESSNKLFLTSWLIHKIRGRRAPPRSEPAGGGAEDGVRRSRSNSKIRAALRLVNRVAEECYRAVLSLWYQARGSIVLFDRHFFADYYPDIDGAPSEWSRRLHGKFLSRIYPKPDLVIYLEAPPELLYARKKEGTIESLDQQCRNYEKLRNTNLRFVSVDASRPLNSVVDDVAKVICHFDKHGTLPGRE